MSFPNLYLFRDKITFAFAVTLSGQLIFYDSVKRLWAWSWLRRRARREGGKFGTTNLSEQRIEMCWICGKWKELFRPLEHFPGDNDHKRAATFLDKVDFRVLRKDRNVCGFCYRVRRAQKDGHKFGTAKLNKHWIASLDPIGFDWEMQEVVPASGTLTGPLNPRLLARGI